MTKCTHIVIGDEKFNLFDFAQVSKCLCEEVKFISDCAVFANFMM